MNENVKKNSIYNYLSRYGIQSHPILKKLKKLLKNQIILFIENFVN